MKAFSSIVNKGPNGPTCFSSKNNLVRRVVDEHHKASWEITKASRSRPCPDSGSMQQDTPRGAKSFRTCRNVGSFEALHWCTDSMSMWPSSFFLTWSRHDCIIGPHVLLRCREQCNHLNLAIEKQQYQWFQEIIKVLRLGKNKCCAIRTQIERQIKLWFINYIGPCQAIHLNQHFDQNHFAIQQIFFRWLHKI